MVIQLEEKCLKVSINALFKAKGEDQFHGKAGGVLLRGLCQIFINRMLPQLKLEVRSTSSSVLKMFEVLRGHSMNDFG